MLLGHPALFLAVYSKFLLPNWNVLITENKLGGKAFH